ncbi:hypothetical protein Tco_0205771 [Tanacetum coccineum]
MLVPQGEGSENPTEPHHTPSAQYESTPQEDQTTSPEPIPQATTLPSQSHPDISTPRRLTRGAIRISQSKAPTPGADETASPTRDDRHGEAFPTATSLDAGQDRENIAKTSAMPHEASPGVTSLGGGEGSMQQKLQELMDMCTNLQQQHLLMEQRIQSQDLEITQLKNRVKTLEDNEKRRVGFAQEDAPNTGGMDQGEDLMTGDVEKSTGKGSDNTDEAANVLSTLEAANVLSSGSFPTAAPAGVATASGSFPTAAIFTTASVTTPYTRRTRASRGIIIEPSHTTSVPTISAKGKGKEKMVESTGTKKKKIQEQLDAQVAKELEMEFAREEQLIREQDEAANLLSTLEAANVLSSGSLPTAAPAGVATASGSFPTAVIFTTTSVTTPYTRRTIASRGIIIEPSHTTSVPTISAKGKGKEKMVEFLGTKKKKIQE